MAIPRYKKGPPAEWGKKVLDAVSSTSKTFLALPVADAGLVFSSNRILAFPKSPRPVLS